MKVQGFIFFKTQDMRSYVGPFSKFSQGSPLPESTPHGDLNVQLQSMFSWLLWVGESPPLSIAGFQTSSNWAKGDKEETINIKMPTKHHTWGIWELFHK